MAEPKASASKDASNGIDTRLVRKLADILADTGLTEIEVEQGDLKIRVAREVTVAPQPMTYAAAAVPAAPAPVAPAPVTAASAPPVEEAAPRGETVKSPMVGTVYMQSQPGTPAFIKVGDHVSAGQTLLIVEAMKTMNPIPTPKGGVVTAILIEDGQPVEYGEPLVVID